MQNETQTITWTVATDEESQWLVRLGDLWTARTQAGWQFVKELQTGIDSYSKRRDKSELYELAANQTGLSTKTLMNYVSLARNENSALAEDLGLDIAHADVVRSLFFDEAQALLLQAAEQSLSADALKAIIRERRQAATAAPGTVIPDAGNVATDEDPPFANRGSVLYQDDEYDELADSFAGDVCAYDYSDDDYTYSIDEMHGLVQRSINRLRDVDNGDQRTLNEWLKQIAAQAY